MQSVDLVILIGTQTGNAERLAEHLAEALEEAGHRPDLVDMADAWPEQLTDIGHLIVCTSTWGDGELPDNAVYLYEGLETYRPDLSHLCYSVVALGDHFYDPHYCEAGRMFERLLDALGAQRAHRSLNINEGPSEEDLAAAREWALQCADAFSSMLARS